MDSGNKDNTPFPKSCALSELRRCLRSAPRTHRLSCRKHLGQNGKKSRSWYFVLCVAPPFITSLIRRIGWAFHSHITIDRIYFIVQKGMALVYQNDYLASKGV